MGRDDDNRKLPASCKVTTLTIHPIGCGATIPNNSCWSYGIMNYMVNVQRTIILCSYCGETFTAISTMAVT
eukprot:1806786-Ditylum_brightwellii.AAC.1